MPRTKHYEVLLLIAIQLMFSYLYQYFLLPRLFHLTDLLTVSRLSINSTNMQDEQRSHPLSGVETVFRHKRLAGQRNVECETTSG